MSRLLILGAGGHGKVVAERGHPSQHEAHSIPKNSPFSVLVPDNSLSALIDLGADKELLLNGLKSLNVEGYNIVISNIVKNGIKACDFEVSVECEDENISLIRHLLL